MTLALRDAIKKFDNKAANTWLDMKSSFANLSSINFSFERKQKSKKLIAFLEKGIQKWNNSFVNDFIFKDVYKVM